MTDYQIGFYNASNDDFCACVIRRKFKCDANALRVVATKMQYRTIVSISYYTQYGRRYILVRFR